MICEIRATEGEALEASDGSSLVDRLSFSGDPKQSVAVYVCVRSDKTSATVGVSCRFSRSASVPADLAVRFGTWCQCRALTHPFIEQTCHPTWVVMRRALSYTTSELSEHRCTHLTRCLCRLKRGTWDGNRQAVGHTENSNKHSVTGCLLAS